MIDKYMLEYELAMATANDIYESAHSTFEATSLEIDMMISNGYYCEDVEIYDMICEASDSLMKSIGEFISKIIESVKDFINKCIVDIQIKIKQHELNKKLKDVKKLLITNKKVSGEKITIFDSVRYFTAYKEYINSYIKSVKSVYAKEYKNISEYTDAVNKCNIELKNIVVKYKLDNTDMYMIELSINKAYEYTEKEVESMTKIQQMYITEWTNAMNTMSEMMKKEDDVSKISDIKNHTNKLAHTTTKSFKKQTDGIYSKINTLISKIKF